MILYIILFVTYTDLQFESIDSCSSWKAYIERLHLDAEYLSEYKIDLNKTFLDVKKQTGNNIIDIAINKDIKIPLFASSQSKYLHKDISTSTKDSSEKGYSINVMEYVAQNYSKKELPAIYGEISKIENIQSYYESYDELSAYKLMFTSEFNKIDCQNKNSWKKYVFPYFEKLMQSYENTNWYNFKGHNYEVVVSVESNKNFNFNFYDEKLVSVINVTYDAELSQETIESILYLLKENLNEYQTKYKKSR